MMMNPGIILSGQGVNVLDAMQQGQRTAAMQNEIQKQNALSDLYRTQGAGIMGGDQNALNALAQIDPTAALGIQDKRLGMDSTRLNMQATRQRMDVLSSQEKRAAEQYARGLSADQKAAEAAQIEDAVKMALALPDSDAWDKFMGSDPQTRHMVGQFNNRQVFANKYMSMADILKGTGGTEPAAVQSLRIRAQEAGLEPGTPAYQEFMARGGKTKDGMVIEQGPDGLRILQGDAAVSGAGAGLGKTAQNALDQKEIDSRDTMARLDRIQGNLDANPALLDAQSLGGQIKTWGLGWQDFISGGNLTAEQSKYLTDVTNMRGDVLENLNFTIKAITGAAMTEPEAKRIGATLPNADDSPTVFKAKLDRALNSTRMAVARYNYWRNNGLEGSPESVGPLSEMSDMISKRAKAIYQEEIAVGDPATARERAKVRLAEEFGLE